VAALFAYLLSYGLRKGWWTIPLGIIAGAGIFLSQTRSTMIGAILAIAVMLIATKRLKWVLALMIAVVLSYLISPSDFKNRYKAGFDPGHQHTLPRLDLVETGIRMIRDNPMLGVGPGAVSIEAPRYKGPEARPEWTYIHLHNNFLQIAAERGVPGLLLWIWFMWRIVADSLQGVHLARIRSKPGSSAERLMVAVAAVGGSTALLAAGMFEYNFGDSEILMLFLFMASAPYADESLPAGAGTESTKIWSPE
jgi:O-antigen ligase